MTDVFGAGQTGVSHELPFPKPESVAPVIVYLASDLAKDVRGQVLSFDGTALSPMPNK